MVRLLILSVLTMLFLSAPFFADASDDEAQFFSSLQDVPLMPGLHELTDQTVSFDDPEGRIVESVALADSSAWNHISDYYNRTLPQLGWISSGPLVFRRDSEILKLTPETLEGRNFLRVTVSPMLK